MARLYAVEVHPVMSVGAREILLLVGLTQTKTSKKKKKPVRRNE